MDDVVTIAPRNADPGLIADGEHRVPVGVFAALWPLPPSPPINWRCFSKMRRLCSKAVSMDSA
jgi:hypothetical protein